MLPFNRTRTATLTYFFSAALAMSAGTLVAMDNPYYPPYDDCSNKHTICVTGICPPTEYCYTTSSLINGIAMWHNHLATDYATQGIGVNATGCAPCGASSNSIGSLPGLHFGRIHNYAFTSQRSSYGPGVYSSYDISLELSTVGYSWSNSGKRTIRVVNPNGGSFVESAYDHDWTQPDFTKTPALSRVDSAIDFDWGTAKPDPTVNADGFSVQWTGTVTPSTSETYTFTTSSDDGVRLWVNGQLLVDQWKNQVVKNYSGAIALIAGQAYAIRMEYYDQGGAAVAKLKWSSPSTPQVTVPSTVLRTASNQPGLDAIYLNSYGAEDGIYYDNDPYGGRNFSELGDIRLYDSNGQLTADQALGVTAVLKKLNGDVLTFKIFRSSTNAATTERFGRLVSITDRNGNTQSLSYTYPVTTDPAQAGGNLAKLWQVTQITDAYNRTATLVYKTTQVAGRWVVDHLTLPNGTSVSFQYNTTSPGLLGLSGVTYPDGTATTISGSYDTVSQCQVIHYDDAGAESTHRRKDVYVTVNTWTNPQTNQVTNQPVGRVRQVMNGANERSFYSQIWRQPNGTHSYLLYEGGNSLSRVDFGSSFNGKPKTTFKATSFNLSQDPSTYTWELGGQNITHDQWYRVTGEKDALGRATLKQVDPVTGNVTQTTYPDNSLSKSTFDQFQQPLVQTDRLGRITKHDYSLDGKGNREKRTAAFGTADQATWQWDYNARGQVLNAYDANYAAATPDLYVTSYVYDAAGYLIKKIDAADITGGTRPIWSYSYDSAGRLTLSTDPEGRKAQYGYDSRNRVTRIDYDDATHEALTYGAGIDANLVTERRDRNGNKTTFLYDGHGRLITKTVAAGTPDAGVSSSAYLTGTNDHIVTQTELGDQSILTYDFRNRRSATTRIPRAGVTLTSATSYDNAQRIAYTQDAYGRKAYPVYDINDRVIRTIRETVPGAITVGMNLATLARDLSANASYLITETTFDAEGQSLSQIDARGVQTAYAYDGQGRLSTQTVASAAPAPLTVLAYRTEFSYDANGNQTLIKHPRTFTESQAFHTAMTYSGRNLPLSTREAVGRAEQATRSRTYTPTGKPKTDTDFKNNTTTMTYYPCCDRLWTVTDPAGGISTRYYDGVGNVTALVDANGNRTDTVYDARLRVASVTQVEEAETSTYTYDDNAADAVGLSATYAAQLAGLGLATGSDGSIVAVTNPALETVVQIRDGLGRAVRSVDGLLHTTTTTYDTIVGNLVTTAVTDALGATTTSLVDGAGRVRQASDAENKLTTLTYDANGNRLSVRDPSAVGQDCLYDAVNRDTTCTDTAGAVTSRLYDAHNNVVSSTDALTKVTLCAFDARDRKATCTDRLSGLTTFIYDNNNNLTSITDAELKVTTYLYDSRNLLTEEVYPPGQATPGAAEDKRTYTYDLGRRLATRVDQSGVPTSYQYDHANRLTERQYPDGKHDQFSYDDASRLMTATSLRFATVVQRAYDDASRLTSEQQTVGGYAYTVGYSHSDDNQVTTMTYPNGKQVSRSYTARKQLATTSYDGGTIATRIYDNSGRLLTTTLGNGLVESRAHHTDNTTNSIVVPGVTNFAYTYDANKRKTYEGHQYAADLQTFGYDHENRVTTWTRDGQESQRWNLSLVGDWNDTTRNGVTQTRTHSGVHETTGITVGAVTTPLAYDKKGNLTQSESGQRYAWDPENRLMTAVVGAATNGYVYDALGRRLGKVANGTATTFVHDGAQVVAEYETPIYQSADIGSPALLGSCADSGSGTITVAASGTDIWGTSDQFRFAYFTLTGDGSIVAKVTSQTNTNMWAKAGVMLRDSLAANARHAFMCITPGNGAAFQRRTTTGGSSANNHSGGGSIAAPAWVRLTRTGTTVTGHYSADGVTWTQGGTATVAFSQATIYAGLAVTSHTNAAVSTATFTNVATTGWVTTTTSPVYARGYVYGSYVDEPLALITPTQKYYYHANHLYSVAALTNNVGVVVERYRYDAYGQRKVLAADGVTTRTASNFGQNLGFTGRFLDNETGLYYFRARYYSGILGRFISRDPLGYVDGKNLYQAYYIPNTTDPTGKGITIKTGDVSCGKVWARINDGVPPGFGTPVDALLTVQFTRNNNCCCCGENDPIKYEYITFDQAPLGRKNRKDDPRPKADKVLTLPTTDMEDAITLGPTTSFTGGYDIKVNILCGDVVVAQVRAGVSHITSRNIGGMQFENNLLEFLDPWLKDLECTPNGGAD